MSGYRIQFIDKILDNVHGFIEFTAVEKEIINLPLFKRLQSIKQLSLTNWIFPGAEHTRFIHSLGVMYVADQMAIQLKYTDEQRQLVRLAGLLHDLGHYPLSHVGERAYMGVYTDAAESIGGDNGSTAERQPWPGGMPSCAGLLTKQRKRVLASLEKLTTMETEGMRVANNPFHHERITEDVIRSDREIRTIIERHCGGCDWITLDNICDIITGNVERNPAISGLVQLVHSELDADRIDYIMRDATFSGTSYGSFELGLFMRNLSRTVLEGGEIIGVHPKGISIADQFLTSRYYSYTQVFFNRHVAILDFMARALTESFIGRMDSEYPSPGELTRFIREHENNTDFLYFTDRAFWDSLHHVALGAADMRGAAAFQKRLLRYQELDLTKNREIAVTFTSVDELMDHLREHPIYQNLLRGKENTIPILYSEHFTRQLPREVFERELERTAESRFIDEREADRRRMRRLQEGITVIEEGEPPILLADCTASLMSRLYSTRVCILREYGMPLD